jgi:hypothetical protein
MGMLLSIGSGFWKVAAGLQLFMGTASLLILAFYPPVHGRMLLVPLDGSIVSEALTTKLLLFRVGEGPLPGSILVDGPGRLVAASLLRDGVVPIGAPPVLCSGDSPVGVIA